MFRLRVAPDTASEHSDSANRIDTKLELDSSSISGMLDEASIRAASLNLVVNAVQAMPGGGRLTVSTGRDVGKLWMTISDTGSGMSPHQINISSSRSNDEDPWAGPGNAVRSENN